MHESHTQYERCDLWTATTLQHLIHWTYWNGTCLTNNYLQYNRQPNNSQATGITAMYIKCMKYGGALCPNKIYRGEC